MQEDFKGLLYGFIFLSLMMVLILTAVVNQAPAYDKNPNEVVNGALDLNKFNSSISDVSSKSQDFREAFEKQSIFAPITAAGVVVTGIFDITKNMVLMIITPFTLIGNVAVTVLHIPSFVVDVILGILIMTIIFSIWRLLRTGS